MAHPVAEKNEKITQEPSAEIASIREGEQKAIGKPDQVVEPATLYLRLHEHEWASYTDEEARRVLQRIDWRIIPLLVVTMTFAGVDKIVISNAALYGMSKDTHLHGQEYIASIFYFGYMISTFPVNAALQKLPVGKVLAFGMLGWGATVMLIGTAQNAAGLMTLRFIMGCFEATLFPCITLLMSMWYTKAEQPLRTAIIFAALSTLVTGLLSYGIGHTNTAITPWRLLFIVLGSLTICWGIILYLFLPDSPLRENFMKGKQKYIAIDRVKKNMNGIEDREFKLYQVLEAFKDYKTYTLFVFYLSMNVSTGGLSTFSAQIVNGLGYSNFQTVLLGMPTGLFQSLAGFLVAIPQRWLTNKRCLSSAICCLIPLACSILIRRLPDNNKAGRLLSFYFFYFFWGPYATVLTLPMANVSGHTKKLTVNGMIFVAYCAAMIIGPQVFIASEAPSYPTGYNSIMIFEIIAMACMAVYGFGCAIENRQRDRAEGKNIIITREESLADKTDYEKRGYRYIY